MTEYRKIIRDIMLYLRLVRPYRASAVLILALLFMNSLFESVGIGLIVPIIDQFSGTGTDNSITRIARVVFTWLGLPMTVTALLVFFFSMIVLKNLVRYCQAVFSQKMYRNLIFDIASQVHNNLMEVAYSYYHHTRKGKIIFYINGGACYAGFTWLYLIDLLMTLLTMACYIGMMLLVSAKLTLLTVAITALTMLLFRRGLGRLFRLSREGVKLNQNVSNVLIESLDGIKTVKAFANEEFEKLRFRRQWYDFLHNVYLTQRAAELMVMFKEPLAIGTILVLIYIARYQLALSLSLVGVFFLMIYRFIPFSQRIIDSLNRLATSLPPVFEALDAIKREDKPYLADGTRAKPDFTSAIELQQLSFSYLAGTPVLNGVSLTIPKNRTTAIVGSTGSGKTTLIDLILRLYDPTSGSLRIDGVDLREIRLVDWRRLVAVVTQDTFLFHDTVRNNIAYGKLDASDAGIEAAARAANAHGFISRLPQGYQTLLGDRGVKLSGGQRQMLALARALVREPEILVLDEATSSLDNESERLVQQSIEQLSGSKTIIVIAHRLSTIVNADQIVVLERGKVAEAGSHAELLARGGGYAKFYQLQFQNGEANA